MKSAYFLGSEKGSATPRKLYSMQGSVNERRRPGGASDLAEREAYWPRRMFRMVRKEASRISTGMVSATRLPIGEPMGGVRTPSDSGDEGASRDEVDNAGDARRDTSNSSVARVGVCGVRERLENWEIGMEVCS